MKIGIPKERREAERRVAASPDTVKRYKALGLEPVVEAGAGAGAAIADEAFTTAGADASATRRRSGPRHRPQGPAPDRGRDGPPAAGPGADRHARPLQQQGSGRRPTPRPGSAAFAMELLPRTTRAQAMDVLSSQANLAGYKALVDAMAEYSRVLPMMMTAAGTVTPAKVFIVGAGVAGLQAIATARRMGAVVTATDVRPAAREETESLGAQVRGLRAGGRRDQGRLRPAADARGAGRAGEDGGRAPQEPGHRRHHGPDPGPQGAADRHGGDGARR